MIRLLQCALLLWIGNLALGMFVLLQVMAN